MSQLIKAYSDELNSVYEQIDALWKITQMKITVCLVNSMNRLRNFIIEKQL